MRREEGGILVTKVAGKNKGYFKAKICSVYSAREVTVILNSV